MKIAHIKPKIRRTMPLKLCFDFMAEIIRVDRVFRQQIAAESATNLPEHSEKCRFAVSACTGVERQDLRSAPGKICVLSAPTQEGRNCAPCQAANSPVKIYRREAKQYQRRRF